MKEFFKTTFAKVFYDPSLDTLFLEYTSKVPNDEQFILVNTEVLKAFTSLRTNKFVADIRKMGIISLQSQQWVVQNLLPGMISHLKGRKLVHAQLLDASEILSKISANNIKSKSTQVAEDFEVVQFTDSTEMNAFLKDRA